MFRSSHLFRSLPSVPVRALRWSSELATESLARLSAVLRPTRPLPAITSPMLTRQAEVPKLPLPTLDQTLDRYLVYVRPLLQDAEFEQTKKWVEELRHGEGKALQKELEQLHHESVSYVAGFWDTMYLELREPLMIHTTPYLVLQADAARSEAVGRLAHLLHHQAGLAAQVAAGTLLPDVEGSVLDMSQHLRMFGSVRLPGWGRDTCTSHLHARHAVLTVNNHLYQLTLFDDKGALVPEGELAAALEQCVADGAGRAPGPNVGAFTALEREAWLGHRTGLQASAPNARVLAAVEEALFVAAYDHEARPADLTSLSRQLLHREQNRWWDKLQYVALADATLGALLEHTPIDGHTVRRAMGEYAAAAAAAPPTPRSERPSPWRRLDWELSAAQLTAVEQATAATAGLAARLSTRAFKFDQYGKEWIKQAKVSPDAYVQMAFQLAYARLYGRPDSTYESCMTKHFLGGRTETIRSVTSESVAFTKAWLSGVSDEAKVAALRTAATAHVTRAGEARQGHGVDRHLFSLRQIASYKHRRLGDIQYTKPAALTDPAMAKLSTSVLSTSNVSAPFLTLFGFGPVCPQGLGLAYNIDDAHMYFNVTSWTGEADAYGNALDSSLREMQNLISRT